MTTAECFQALRFTRTQEEKIKWVLLIWQGDNKDNQIRIRLDKWASALTTPPSCQHLIFHSFWRPASSLASHLFLPVLISRTQQPSQRALCDEVAKCQRRAHLRMLLLNFCKPLNTIQYFDTHLQILVSYEFLGPVTLFRILFIRNNVLPDAWFWNRKALLVYNLWCQFSKHWNILMRRRIIQ